MFVFSAGQYSYFELLIQKFLNKVFQFTFVHMFKLFKSGPLEYHISKIVKSCGPDRPSMVRQLDRKHVFAIDQIVVATAMLTFVERFCSFFASRVVTGSIGPLSLQFYKGDIYLKLRSDRTEIRKISNLILELTNGASFCYFYFCWSWLDYSKFGVYVNKLHSLKDGFVASKTTFRTNVDLWAKNWTQR